MPRKIIGSEKWAACINNEIVETQSSFRITGRISISTVWIPSLRQGRKEGNVLFNDALNTFYLRLYGIRHMVKNHSDRERGNLLVLPPHRLLFLISSKVLLYASSHRQENTYYSLCYTSHGTLAGTKKFETKSRL